MSGFDVHTAELLAAQSVVAEAAASGRSALDRLEADADDVLGHGWQGMAATAFGRGWQQWHEGVQQVLAGLDEMGAALGATARAYATREAANVERFVA